MSFFKSSTERDPDNSIVRLHTTIWVLIYGGLLALVFGVVMQRFDEALGWWLVGAGGVLTVVGTALIYVRSRIK
jgi:uncharacterized membrane protein